MQNRSTIIFIFSLFMASSYADEVIFDYEALKYKGIPEDVANKFGKKSVIPPGLASVSLFLNNNYLGQEKLTFNNDGDLCLNESFIHITNVILKEINSTCPTIKDYNNFEVEIIPEKLQVNIFISPSLIKNKVVNNWIHDGKSGVLNYDIKYLSSKNDFDHQSYLNSNFTLGVNASDWIVRSNQNYTYINGESQFNHQTLYAEKTLEKNKKNLQIGQINLSNAFFNSGQVIGFQLTPESALVEQNEGGGVVTGIASSRSIIEVRQAGILIYTTTVPEGPYTLENLPLLNYRLDLVVTVTNQNGNKDTFTVPASSFMLSSNYSKKGITFGVGKVNQTGIDKKPWVFNVSKGFNLQSDINLNSGAIISKDYQSIGLDNNYQLSRKSIANLTTLLSKDKNYDYGMYYALSYSYSIKNNIGLTVNSSYRDKAYIDFNETLNDYYNIYSNHSANNEIQYGLSVNSSFNNLGSFSLSWNRSIGDRTVDYYNASWNKMFNDKYNAYLSYEKRLYNEFTDNAIYLNIDVSLGNKKHLSSWTNHYDDSQTYGVRYSDYDYDNFSYSISANKNTNPNNESTSLSMNYKASSTSLSGALNKSTNSHSYYGSLSGGIVLYDSHIILSPYRIGKTFGIANSGNTENIPIQSSSGTIFTDNNGYAVISNLDAYRKNYAKIDPQKLAKNINASGAIIEFSPAKGSVPLINFNVEKVNRAIIKATFNGDILPKNKKVYDREGNLITITDNAGRIIIDNLVIPTHYTVELNNNKQCLIDVADNIKSVKTSIFTIISLSCIAIN